MAKSKRPTKTRIKKASGAVSQAVKKEMTSKMSKSEFIDQAKENQATIDRYNNEIIYQIDPFFKTVQMHGSWLIVRLFQEDLIKHLDESNPDDVHIDAYIRMIDARQRTSDKPEWIPTPFPYLTSGVICAISPDIQVSYLKKAKEEEELIGKTNIVIPEVGDTCFIKARNSQWMKEHRFYIDKQGQCKDMVRNQHELRLGEFEGYFIMEDYDLELIIKDGKKGKFKDHE